MVHPQPPRWDELDDDDPELLRQAIGPVRPLKRAATPPPAGPRPQPVARQFERDEREALQASRSPDLDALDPGETSEFRQPGVSPQILRRLRRGLYAVQDEIDLHHSTLAEANRMLAEFLRAAMGCRFRCVRVIHGKGLHSESGRPILRPEIERQLRLRREVLAYCSAPPRLGGTGALLVLLKPPAA